MPQKKNSALSHLPPLLFVNSPVYQPAPVLTPDLAVDHPVTAKVVPFESVIETSWVSPQFRTLHGCLSSHQNYQSLRQTSIYGRLTQLKPDIYLKSCKFRPLQFVNCNNNEPDIQAKPASGREVYPACLEVCSTDHNIVEEVQFSCVEITDNIVIPTPALTGQGDGSACLDGNRGHNQPATIHPSSGKTIEATPAGIPRRDTVQKGLMKPHNLFCDSRYTCSDATQSNDLDDSSGQVKTLNGLITSKLGLGTPLKATDNVFESDENNHCPRTSNLMDIPNVLTSDLLINQNSGSSHQTKAGSAILVVDTPVSDYGLTFRQRQLRYKSMLNN